MQSDLLSGPWTLTAPRDAHRPARETAAAPRSRYKAPKSPDDRGLGEKRGDRSRVRAEQLGNVADGEAETEQNDRDDSGALRVHGAQAMAAQSVWRSRRSATLSTLTAESSLRLACAIQSPGVSRMMICA